MTEFNALSKTILFGDIGSIVKDVLSNATNTFSISSEDPNGFNLETVMVLKEVSERKNLSHVYNSLEELYEDLDV